MKLNSLSKHKMCHSQICRRRISCCRGWRIFRPTDVYLLIKEMLRGKKPLLLEGIRWEVCISKRISYPYYIVQYNVKTVPTDSSVFLCSFWILVKLIFFFVKDYFSYFFWWTSTCTNFTAFVNDLVMIYILQFTIP